MGYEGRKREKRMKKWGRRRIFAPLRFGERGDGEEVEVAAEEGRVVAVGAWAVVRRHGKVLSKESSVLAMGRLPGLDKKSLLHGSQRILEI